MNIDCFDVWAASGGVALVLYEVDAIEWIVGHPLLVVVRQHGEAYTFQLWVFLDVGPKRFGVDILFCLYLQRNDGVRLLYQEVDLYP